MGEDNAAVSKSKEEFGAEMDFGKPQSANIPGGKLAGAEGFEPSPSSLTVRCPTSWTTPQREIAGDEPGRAKWSHLRRKSGAKYPSKITRAANLPKDERNEILGRFKREQNGGEAAARVDSGSTIPKRTEEVNFTKANLNQM